MRAIIQDRFGPPASLRLAQASRPEIGPDDVLIRVRAAALNPADWHILRGDPLVARLLPGGVGLVRPRVRVAGIDAAGEIAAVGVRVRGMRPGDEVLGFVPGAFAEYARAEADKVLRKPARLTFEQAAAIPTAATTAWRAMTQAGQVRSGSRVLINGASGGVGTFAVQIAVALGAEVTGVCGARNAGLVRSLGAERVIDYTAEDFTAQDFTAERGRYDVILDNAGGRPLRRLRSALAADGILVLNAGGPPGKVLGPFVPMIRATIADRFARQHLRILPARQDRAELAEVLALAEDGKLTPVVSRTYPLAEAASGLRQVEAGHARGKLVITVP